MTRRFLLAAALGLSCLLGGCLGGNLRPLQGLNLQLARGGTSHSPGLSGNWLALITGRQGREQVLLVNLSNSAPVPLLGLNRLALVRQREGRTELVLYRRSLQSLQAIPMEPAGVPRRVQLSADGRVLAVEVSRGGQWQVDLLTLP